MSYRKRTYGKCPYCGEYDCFPSKFYDNIVPNKRYKTKCFFCGGKIEIAFNKKEQNNFIEKEEK